MPETEVIYYCEDDGTAPVLEWLAEIGRRNRKAAVKCTARIEVLGELGHELRRPMADYLRDGIYELRVRAGRVNYRILYFFHGQNVLQQEPRSTHFYRGHRSWLNQRTR